MPTTVPTTARAIWRRAVRRTARTRSPRPRRAAAADAVASLGGVACAAPPTAAGGLPVVLQHELAVILADGAWGLYRGAL